MQKYRIETARARAVACNGALAGFKEEREADGVKDATCRRRQFKHQRQPELQAVAAEDLVAFLSQELTATSWTRSWTPAWRYMDDTDGAVEPAPTGSGGGDRDPEIDKLSNIIKTFNDLFGNIDWKDADKIRKVIAEEIPARVAQDKAYQNAVQNSDNNSRCRSRVQCSLLPINTA